MNRPATSNQSARGVKSQLHAGRYSQLAIRTKNANGEGGYALVALLVVMSLLALFAMAAASNVKQQAQREREKEAIFRGEQVADAIRSYYQPGRSGRQFLADEHGSTAGRHPNSRPNKETADSESRRGEGSTVQFWRVETDRTNLAGLRRTG